MIVIPSQAFCIVLTAMRPAAPMHAQGGASRLGLKLEQRGDVRRLVEQLGVRVRQAGADLAAAVNEIQQLQANNSALVAQLAAATGGAGHASANGTAAAGGEA